MSGWFCPSEWLDLPQNRPAPGENYPNENKHGGGDGGRSEIDPIIRGSALLDLREGRQWPTSLIESSKAAN
jgi:hypothetical protein